MPFPPAKNTTIPLPVGASAQDYISGDDFNQVAYPTATGSTTPRSAADRAADVVNVKDYGAAGNGVTDDTAAIQAANDAVEATGAPGLLYCPTGTFLVSVLNLGPNVSIRGNGVGATRIKMKTGANAAAVIQTKNFASLTGTASTAGSFRNQITDLTIDGNKSGNTAGRGLQLYGKAFLLQNLSVESAFSDGVYTEYGGADNFSTPAGTLEARYVDLSIQQNGGAGMINNGPHDAIVERVVIFSNGGWGWDVRTPMHAQHVNTYLNPSGGIWVHGSGSITGHDVIGSTATGWGMLIDTGTPASTLSDSIFGGGNPSIELRSYNHNIHGIISGGTLTGLKLNGGAGNFNFTITGYATWFDVTGQSGPSNALVQSSDASGTVFSGVPSGNWVVVDSNLSPPRSGPNGLQLLPYADAVDVLRVKTAANLTVFDVSTNGTPRLELVNGASFNMFSDNFGTSKVAVNGLTGKIATAGPVSPGTDGGAMQGGQIFQGAGVPNNANGANGDIYFRTDTPGTVNQRMYMKAAGAWVALAL